MKRINLLDENTSNKIAAGEVVERPSSVVKELIENSIDANARNITIEIEEGGEKLIKIIDDGDGIHPEDIKKAFLPHATSKIKNSSDIFSINTLGFRGEALPSIAAVSKVSLKSKIQEEDFGREIIIEGGEILSFNECGINKGTSIEVKDLFFNVPARKKFLKTSSREASLISDIVSRIALANPSISFKLFNNGKKILNTYGNSNLLDVTRTIYGKNIGENIIYFEHSEDTLTLYGYIGKEVIARGSRNNQSIFVNGRYIKNRTLVVAVENAFKSFSTVNKFPFFILFIEVYPENIDVNIHPSKAEIKFKDERLIFKKVFDTVHEALRNEIFKEFEVKKDENTNFKKDEFKEISFDIKDDYEKKERTKVTLPVDLNYERTYSKDYENIYEKEYSNSSSSKYLEETKTNNNVNYNNIDSKESNTLNENFTLRENFYKDNVLDEKTSKIPKEYLSNTKDNERIPKFPPLRIIGQFNKTYILGEYDEVLYIIDQHAAHEKILFEKYFKNIEEGSIIIQPLLVPEIIDLTLDDFSYYEENKEIFKNAGFTLEEFGGNSLALKEVPYFLGKLDAKGLFLSILDNIKELGSGKTPEVKYNKIATMACKAAVKGHDLLSEQEMIKLVEDLRYINDPFHCPHGRPTIIKFTNYDLEKKFRRIV
ncbi:MAG: DNA mismatch repair endonuclease MutL [Clostridium sp.]|mgnify:FL=1|nr:DNA mismatch repair endonuclease MutL [Clostridium sp.]